MPVTHLVVLHGCCMAPKTKRMVIGESIDSGVGVGVSENRVVAPYYTCVLNSTLRKAGVGRTVLPKDCRVSQPRHPHPEAEQSLLKQRSEYLTDLQEEEEAYIDAMTGVRQVPKSGFDPASLPVELVGPIEWGLEEFVHLRMPEIAGYLAHPTLRDSTLKRLAEQLPREPYVLVAHTLGSVIAYELLHRSLSTGTSAIRLPNAFVTVSSPLGLKTFTDRLPDSSKVADAMPTAWLFPSSETPTRNRFWKSRAN